KNTMAELDRRVQERTGELGASRERLAAMFRSAPMAQLIIDHRGPDGLEVNEALCQLTGCELEIWQHRASAIEAIKGTGLGAILSQSHPITEVEAVIRNRSGQEKNVILSSVVLTLAESPALLLMIQDCTERRRLESDLRQLQKMEAVGQLAAGVAHDFNNLLTVITGNAHMARDARGKNGDYEVLLLDEIIQSATRAGDLTRQLLAFTRHQVFQPRQTDLNSIVENQLSLLTRLLGEHIEILWQPGVGLGAVSVDIASLEQVILNLAINARDAMPGGGQLTLTTSSLHFEDEQQSSSWGVAPGAYVMLVCADTGHGMSTEVADRAFEPFFTTKETGKGTGLGLASTYGIITRHRGSISIEPHRESGTALRFLLPVDQSDPIPHEIPRAPVSTRGNESPCAHGSLRILLVEDEPSVRRIGIRLLQSLGHQVIEAIDGHSGLAKWRECRNEIDLVVSDMVMPGGMSGLQLAKTLQLESPQLPIILASGYSAEMLREDNFIPGPYRSFLPKPYDRAGLEARIKEFSISRSFSTESEVTLPG
ncbi:MAG TPA: response regulator, partial [Verrucomicrobiales bacterium]|nr:response regulator [Verrucomicrobiales bacterium]